MSETAVSAETGAVQAGHVLREVARRVLWLSSAIVDAANHDRDDVDGLKVGGHQASSASMVDIIVALWFSELTATDRVAVKPHASPVLHAVNYLLGDLDISYLSTLRSRGGLQAYPSRTKDPDTVDFSTGSVGIGATAPLWAALTHRYLRSHFPHTSQAGRFISLLGDAELDEGAIWEAVTDPSVSKLGELLWVVDLNRQSLDRVVPDIQIQRLSGMFAAAGWEVLTLKWGGTVSKLFEQTGGSLLRERLEAMSNEEYQRLLRVPVDEVADRLLGERDDGRLIEPELVALVRALPPQELADVIRDLGGHDLGLLLETFRNADAHRPTVVFAYTVKGRGLPTEGHPNNHSALLTPHQMDELAIRCGTDPADPWARFEEGSDADRLCHSRGSELRRNRITDLDRPKRPLATVPVDRR